MLISFIITPGSSCTGYQIQRSSDSVNFEILYDYNAICGDLTKPQNIFFTDEKPLKNSFNYYRIFIPPQDYSNITSVIFNDISENGYLLYNNPISETLLLLGNSKGALQIYNQNGKLLNTFFSNEEGLFKEESISWPAGLFYFKIETNIGKNIGGKFIKR
ncbi:MAG: T9SS type A sorting domain-containing protein [Burkholderiales bacterium]|nr:T9SS type A sorting domain-containing protein [Bacteroidia bacterium]